MATYQRKDAYHQRAKREGYRSRAAYKLLEIQRAHGLLRRGQRVVDLGCWPGGWLQVAAAEVGPKGRVVGVDLAPMEPLTHCANVVALIGDIAEPVVLESVLKELDGEADILLCDAAPKLTGIRATDRAQEEALLEAVEAALPGLLRRGGGLLLKLLDGPEAEDAQRRIRRRFEGARSVKPAASRRGSTERYLLAQSYQG